MAENHNIIEYRMVAQRLLGVLGRVTLHAPQVSDVQEWMTAKKDFEALEKSVLCPGSKRTCKKVCSHCGADCGLDGMGGAVDHLVR